MLTRENLKTHWWYRLIKVCFITSLFSLLILVVITAYGEIPVAVPNPYYPEPSTMSQSGNFTPAMRAAFDKVMGVQSNPNVDAQPTATIQVNPLVEQTANDPLYSSKPAPPISARNYALVPYNYQEVISEGASPFAVVNYLAQQTGYNAMGALAAGYSVNDVLAYMSKLPQKTATTLTADETSQPKSYSGSWWNVVLWLIGGIVVVALIGWVAKTIFFYVFIGEKPSIF